MLRAFLRWIQVCVFGARGIPCAGEQWLFVSPRDPRFSPVTITACDGATVWYVFESGLRSDLDVRRFVAWYRRVG